MGCASCGHYIRKSHYFSSEQHTWVTVKWHGQRHFNGVNYVEFVWVDPADNQQKICLCKRCGGRAVRIGGQVAASWS